MPHQLLPLVYKALGHSAILVTLVGSFAAVDFSSTVTLGSLLVAFVVIVIAGLFTIRSKIANIWREEAEGERAAKERCQEALIQEKTSRLEFEKEQQELRHDLKGEIAGLKAQLKAMEAKTDLTTALETIKQMNEASVTAISGAIKTTFEERSRINEERDNRTHVLLEEIRDKLPNEPLDVHEVGPPQGGR